LPTLAKDQQEEISRAAAGCRILFDRKSLTEEDYREAEVVLGWTSQVQNALEKGDTKIRWIQSTSSGVDYFPMELLKKRGVVLTDASGVHAFSVSESAIAMMLAFARGIAASVRNQAGKIWDRAMPTRELGGATLTIAGAGHIGRRLAHLAKAFDMRVIAVTRSGNPLPEADETYDASRLDEAISQADYVVNILPLTGETHYLFDEERFSRMKNTAYFINVGRGPTVRTEDLVKALESGQIAGAGLDVFEEEPLPPEHPLWAMNNVILTPHNAGGITYENRKRLVKLFTANLELYLSGQAESMRNVVDYEKQY
jgi:phosphoglycerate dehydrogenase-like enzyme